MSQVRYNRAMLKKDAHIGLPWITAILGLAVMVINFVNGSMFHNFLKKQPVALDHAYMPHFPAEELLFLIGLALFVGGIAAGVRQMRK